VQARPALLVPSSAAAAGGTGRDPACEGGQHGAPVALAKSNCSCLKSLRYISTVPNDAPATM
jgi:hypothetical protein